MKIVLIEFIDEFESFLSFLRKQNHKLEDFVIIALEPQLQAYLKKRNITYRNTLQYFNNDSHKKIIIETEKIMRFIRSDFKFVDKNGLRHCYEIEFAHYTRFFLNHIFKMLEILENVYKENNKCDIYAYVYRKIGPGCMITDAERYLGLLSERFAKTRKLYFINIANNTSPHEIISTKKRSFMHLEKLLTMLWLLLLRNKNVIFVPRGGALFKSLLAQISKRERRTVFLAMGHSDGLLKVMGYNILSLFRTLSGSTSSHYYLVNTDCFYKWDEKEKVKFENSIDSMMDHQDELLFQYNGINYGDLLRDKVHDGIKIHMLQMLSQSHNLRYLFNRFNRRLVMSFSALGVMAVAGELSGKMGMKSLFVSHGAHPVPVDSYHETEMINLCRGFMLSNYTHVALSTPIQEEHLRFFKRKYDWVKNQELKTGPLVFADLKGTDKSLYKRKLGISPDELVLTYAITSKNRSSERYYFLETMDEFISSLADIVNILNENVRLLIRIHPGFHLTNDEIKTLLPESRRYIIHREGPFSEALAASDILISYSSTAIDEALINGIPVLLYDKWNRYNHFKTGVYANPKSPDIFPVCYVNNGQKLNEAAHSMMDKIKVTQKKDIATDKYCYNTDYRENLYSFINEAKQEITGGRG